MDATIYIDGFMKNRRERYSKNTIDAYKRDLENYFKYSGTEIESINDDQIESYCDHLLQKNQNPKTINRKLGTIKRFIDYYNSAVAPIVGVQPVNANIQMLKIQKQQFIKDMLRTSDYNRLIRSAEKTQDLRALALMEGMKLTGARVSEVLQIKVDQIDEDSIRVKGKGNKYRELFIPEALKHTFRKYIQQRGHGPEDMLFINRTNHKLMDRQEVNKDIKKHCGLSKVSLKRGKPHNFRHLYGFTMAKEGVMLHQLADLMGHSDINTTRIYTMATREDLMKVVNDIYNRDAYVRYK